MSTRRDRTEERNFNAGFCVSYEYMLPLSFIDGILLGFNMGQILFVGFLLTTVGALPLKSQKLIGLNTSLFGLIFILTPADMMPELYLFFGITLIVIGPIVYATAKN